MIESVQGYDARGAALAKREADVQRHQARIDERAAERRAENRAEQAAAADARAAERKRQRVDVRA